MSALDAFGVTAVGSMLIFYALEHRAPAFILAFAAACIASSVYGFAAGAWPFGLIEIAWAGVAVRRWLDQ